MLENGLHYFRRIPVKPLYEYLPICELCEFVVNMFDSAQNMSFFFFN